MHVGMGETVSKVIRRGMKSLALLAALAVPLDLFAGAGLLERVRPPFYAERIDLHVGPVTLMTRAEFMASYSEETLLYLRTRGLLDGYEGTDLDADRVVDRRSAAFLLGRLIQDVEQTRGRLFPDVESDLRHVLMEPEMWGHHQVGMTLRAGLMHPYKVSDWWRKPITRFELARISARAVQALSSRLRVFRYYRGEPAAGYWDLHAYPGGVYPGLARALRTGVIQGASEGTFGGRDLIRGHEMSRTLRRLLLISRAYDPAA